MLLNHHEYCIQAALNKTHDGVELSALAFFDDVDPFPFEYIWSSMCGSIYLHSTSVFQICGNFLEFSLDFVNKDKLFT